MKSAENLRLTGHLIISKDYNDRGSYVVFEEKNLITLATKIAILTLIHTGGTGDPINRLRVGTGGCIDPEGLFPKPEDQTQTNLNTPFLTVNTTHTEDNAIPSTTFLADLDQATGNNNLVTEAGLITTAGNLFNLKNFPGIQKTSDFSLHFEWTIKFA